MKNYAILRDAVEEKVFGLVIEQDGGFRFYGADDRAKEWANWANSTSLKSLQEALPVGVIANEKRPLINDTELFIESLIESASNAGDVKKPTFSYKSSHVTRANSSTPSARDFQLRSFDVGTRQNAINFKVSAFKNDQKSSSLMAKIRSAGLGFNEKTGEFRSNDITISHSSLQHNIETTYTKSLQRNIGFNVMSAKNIYAKSLTPFYTHPKVIELKRLGGTIGPKLGRGLRSAPMGMVFVDVTGAIDADKDGIVFEGKPGLERPIIPKFILPEGVGRRVASLIGGAAEQNEKNRRSGAGGGGAIDEIKLRDILGTDASSLNKLNASSPFTDSDNTDANGMRSIVGNIRSRRDAIIAKRTGSANLSRVGVGEKTQLNTGDSRAVEKMTWDDSAKELIVTFAGGRTYTYNNVDDSWVDELEKNPDALGRIMNDIKKAGYDFTSGGTHAPDKTLASRMQGRREAAGMRSSSKRPDATEVLAPEEIQEIKDAPLYKIASMIRADLSRQGKKMPFGAEPYIDALSSLDSIDENYGQDSGQSIVAYALSNLTQYKGPKARAIKSELNARLKGRSSAGMGSRSYRRPYEGTEWQNKIPKQGTPTENNPYRFDFTPDDLSGADLSGADLGGAQLRGKNLTKAQLNDIEGSEIDLSNTNLTRANLQRSILTRANLSDADLTGADLTQADLTGAGLQEANLTNAIFQDANLTRADLTGANLEDANLRAYLDDADLTGANLSGARMEDASLIDADLRKANLGGANLKGANLTRANMEGAELYGANLTEAEMSGANLTEADLRDANLTSAELYDANMEGADLTGANLTRANLYSADLTGADLTQADLTGADLTGADLRGADLTGAILKDADLTGAKLDQGWEQQVGMRSAKRPSKNDILAGRKFENTDKEAYIVSDEYQADLEDWLTRFPRKTEADFRRSGTFKENVITFNPNRDIPEFSEFSEDEDPYDGWSAEEIEIGLPEAFIQGMGSRTTGGRKSRNHAADGRVVIPSKLHSDDREALAELTGKEREDWIDELSQEAMYNPGGRRGGAFRNDSKQNAKRGMGSRTRDLTPEGQRVMDDAAKKLLDFAPGSYFGDVYPGAEKFDLSKKLHESLYELFEDADMPPHRVQDVLNAMQALDEILGEDSDVGITDRVEYALEHISPSFESRYELSKGALSPYPQGNGMGSRKNPFGEKPGRESQIIQQPVKDPNPFGFEKPGRESQFIQQPVKDPNPFGFEKPDGSDFQYMGSRSKKPKGTRSRSGGMRSRSGDEPLTSQQVTNIKKRLTALESAVESGDKEAQKELLKKIFKGKFYLEPFIGEQFGRRVLDKRPKTLGRDGNSSDAPDKEITDEDLAHFIKNKYEDDTYSQIWGALLHNGDDVDDEEGLSSEQIEEALPYIDLYDTAMEILEEENEGSYDTPSTIEEIADIVGSEELLSLELWKQINLRKEKLKRNEERGMRSRTGGTRSRSGGAIDYLPLPDPNDESPFIREPFKDPNPFGFEKPGRESQIIQQPVKDPNPFGFEKPDGSDFQYMGSRSGAVRPAGFTQRSRTAMLERTAIGSPTGMRSARKSGLYGSHDKVAGQERVSPNDGQLWTSLSSADKQLFAERARARESELIQMMFDKFDIPIAGTDRRLDSQTLSAKERAKILKETGGGIAWVDPDGFGNGYYLLNRQGYDNISSGGEFSIRTKAKQLAKEARIHLANGEMKEHKEKVTELASLLRLADDLRTLAGARLQGEADESLLDKNDAYDFAIDHLHPVSRTRIMDVGVTETSKGKNSRLKTNAFSQSGSNRPFEFNFSKAQMTTPSTAINVPGRPSSEKDDILRSAGVAGDDIKIKGKGRVGGFLEFMRDKLGDQSKKDQKAEERRIKKLRASGVNIGSSVDVAELETDRPSLLDKRAMKISRIARKKLLNAKARKIEALEKSAADNDDSTPVIGTVESGQGVVATILTPDGITALARKLTVGEKEWKKSYNSKGRNGSGHSLAFVWKAVGMNGTPHPINEEEFKELLAAGWKPIKRGTGSRGYGLSYFDNPKRHLPMQGQAYGPGEYWSTGTNDTWVGGYYPEPNGELGDGPGGIVGLLPPTAKIMTAAELSTIRDEHLKFAPKILGSIRGYAEAVEKVQQQDFVDRLVSDVFGDIPRDSAVWDSAIGQMTLQLISALESNPSPEEFAKLRDALFRLTALVNQQENVYGPIFGADALDMGNDVILVMNRAAVSVFADPLPVAEIISLSQGRGISSGYVAPGSK